MSDIDIDGYTGGQTGTHLHGDRSAPPTLRSRGAGDAVMQKCLEVQDDAPRRGRFARLVGVSPLHPDAVGWYEGALGELETGRRLAALGAGYTVLHSLPIGDGDGDLEPEDDVDHLVIGAAGVFCLSSSRGVTAERIAEVQGDARRVSKHLSRALQRVIPVTPLLVNVGDPVKKGAPEVPIEVIPSRALSRWFARRAPVLTVAEIATIALAAEQPATWRAPASTVLSSVDVDEFDRLKHQVDAAIAREHSALTVAVIVGLGVLAATGAEIAAYLGPQLLHI